MDIQKGQIVFSRAGRDITDVYTVVAVEGERLLLANGAKRTLQAPKPKNKRHVIATNTHLAAEEMDTDVKLKVALAGYIKTLEPELQGG